MDLFSLRATKFSNLKSLRKFDSINNFNYYFHMLKRKTNAVPRKKERDEKTPPSKIASRFLNRFYPLFFERLPNQNTNNNSAINKKIPQMI